MNCTHPVLYAKLDGLYCHICGAKLRVDEVADKTGRAERKARRNAKNRPETQSKKHS